MGGYYYDGMGYDTYQPTGVGGSGATPPVNTVAPAVTGTETQGQTLSTTDGTWTGTATISYTYQWQRAGVNIGSATANTYLLVLADVGSAIRCVVTGTNAAGNASANSNSTGAIAASGIAFVRSFTQPVNGTSVIPVPAAGCAAGNLVVVNARCPGGFSSGVTDSKSNTWTRGTSYDDGSVFATVAWSILTTPLVSGDNITFGGTTITCGVGGEFSGAAAVPLDKQAVSTGVGAGTVDSTDTATLTAANDLYICCLTNSNTAQIVTDTTAGLTTVSANPGGIGTVYLKYKILAATTAIDYKGTTSASSIGVWVGAFLAA